MGTWITDISLEPYLRLHLWHTTPSAPSLLFLSPVDKNSSFTEASASGTLTGDCGWKQPWKSKHCVRLGIPHCWVQCSHGLCLRKRIPLLNLTPWQCCGVLRCADFSNHPKFTIFLPPLYPLDTYLLSEFTSGTNTQVLPLRYFLDPSISLHLIGHHFSPVHLLVATAGISSLITPHPNVLSPHPATPSLSTLQQKNCLATQCHFWMMCFLVMLGWRTHLGFCRACCRTWSLLPPSSFSHCAPLAVSALLALPPQKILSIPSPTLRFPLPGTCFFILSSDLAQWLLLQGNPRSFLLKSLSLFGFSFLNYIPWVLPTVTVILVVSWHWHTWLWLFGCRCFTKL